MNIEELKSRENPTIATAAIAVVLCTFILTTMGFSSSAFRALHEPDVQQRQDTLLGNREVFVGVDTSFAAYQNAIRQ